MRDNVLCFAGIAFMAIERFAPWELINPPAAFGFGAALVLPFILSRFGWTS